MKFAIIQIKCRPCEGTFTQSADGELEKTELNGVEVLFVTGIVWENIPENIPKIKTTISPRQVMLVVETQGWAHRQANHYGIPVVMENFKNQNTNQLMSKCSLRFEKDRGCTMIASPGKVVPKDNSMAVVFSEDITEEWVQTTLRDGVSFVVVHVNSKLQNSIPEKDQQSIEKHIGALREPLRRLEHLITTSYPITVLISNCMECAGINALLRIDDARVYVYKIWGCNDTWLDEFDTRTILSRTINHRRDKLSITEDRRFYWEHDRVVLGFQWLLDPKIWRSWLLDRYRYLPDDLRLSTLVVVSMKEQGQEQSQTEKENRKHWLSKLQPDFIPALSGELIFIVFTNREIPEILVSGEILHKFRGQEEPGLRAVYTNKLIGIRLKPLFSFPEVEQLDSVGEYDIYVVSNWTYLSTNTLGMNRYHKRYQSEPTTPID